MPPRKPTAERPKSPPPHAKSSGRVLSSSSSASFGSDIRRTPAVDSRIAPARPRVRRIAQQHQPEEGDQHRFGLDVGGDDDERAFLHREEQEGRRGDLGQRASESPGDRLDAWGSAGPRRSRREPRSGTESRTAGRRGSGRGWRRRCPASSSADAGRGSAASGRRPRQSVKTIQSQAATTGAPKTDGTALPARPRTRKALDETPGVA